MREAHHQRKLFCFTYTLSGQWCRAVSVKISQTKNKTWVVRKSSMTVWWNSREHLSRLTVSPGVPPQNSGSWDLGSPHSTHSPQQEKYPHLEKPCSLHSAHQLQHVSRTPLKEVSSPFCAVKVTCWVLSLPSHAPKCPNFTRDPAFLGKPSARRHRPLKCETARAGGG